MESNKFRSALKEILEQTEALNNSKHPNIKNHKHAFVPWVNGYIRGILKETDAS